MKVPSYKTIGPVLCGLLSLSLVKTPAIAQTGKPPRADLEQIMYQDLIGKLAVDAAETPARAPAVPSAVPSGILVKSGPSWHCLPTCDSTDGRFLSIAGQNLATLSGSDLNLQISVLASATSFSIGFFDGDARGVDAGGASHWDTGTANAVYTYTLYTDPAADGRGTTVVEMAAGSPVLTGAAMPDNAWLDLTVPTSPSAQAPSGNFFYRLSIRLTTPAFTTLNAFKVRTSALLSGMPLDAATRPLSYIVNPTSQADLRILYPSYPATSPTTYDGRFSFFFEAPSSMTSLSVWDGDFDHGKFTGDELDTNDPDTPDAPFRAPWATVDTVPEGTATGLTGTTGNPPDDRNPAGSGIYSQRSPSIRYDLIAPGGQVFANDNPSGNLEWEQFRISTDPFDRSRMDYHADVIPAGIYEMRVQGLDMVNLNAVLLPFKVICIDAQGAPCKILRPFAVGDTVFADLDGDRNQGAEEPGIPGVLLELRDIAGALIATTLTGAEGHYRFEVDAGTFEVVVAASSFAPGGPLAGSASTTGDSRTDTVNGDNVLTYDFGYRGASSISGRVWYDLDGDGLQTPDETGLKAVAIDLLDAGGALIASTATGGDGLYLFTGLPGGTDTVHVVTATLPDGSIPTYDPDGTVTPSTAQVAADQNRQDVSFGYRGNLCAFPGKLEKTLPSAPAPAMTPPRNPDYWASHAGAWPVSMVLVGGRLYTKNRALELLGASSQGDQGLALFQQVLSAKLSFLTGANPARIYTTLEWADAWLAAYPAGGDAASRTAAAEASAWLAQLESYTRGVSFPSPRP